MKLPVICTVFSLAPGILVPLMLSAQPRVSAGVSNDSVLVGMPYTLTVRVRAGPHATVEFPAAPDSGSAVRLLDPRIVNAETFADSSLHYATYRLAAWDIDTRSSRIGNVYVSDGGRVQQFTVPFPMVHVATVLPPDSSTHVPRPARSILPPVPSWWFPWLPLAALVGALVLIHRWWRARRIPVPGSTAGSVAVTYGFQDVEAMRLLELGEFGRHAALMIDAMKASIAARVAGGRVLSNRELIWILVDDDAMPAARVSALLDWGDQIKYAAIPISRAQAVDIAHEAAELESAVADAVNNNQLVLQGEGAD